jgi:uncharacterized membrane-anchored protein
LEEDIKVCLDDDDDKIFFNLSCSVLFDTKLATVPGIMNLFKKNYVVLNIILCVIPFSQAATILLRMHDDRNWLPNCR